MLMNSTAIDFICVTSDHCKNYGIALECIAQSYYLYLVHTTTEGIEMMIKSQTYDNNTCI